MSRSAILLIVIVLLVLMGIMYIQSQMTTPRKNQSLPQSYTTNPTLPKNQTIQITPEELQLPTSVIIPQKTHTFQTFNNCGPAGLSMQLSYFDVNISQYELGSELRPYQVSSGYNDDKSVTLEELASKAQELGFKTYHRPAGSIELIKGAIAKGIPVLVRTWTSPNEDIGHYRLVRGYDDATQEIIQDDSLQGRNLRFSYSEFNAMWHPFNNEYLIIVLPMDSPLIENILGDYSSITDSWVLAKKRLEEHLKSNSDDVYAIFNLSIAEYNLGNYEKSIAHFEEVENQLPFRTLWYQIEPIKAYQQLGKYDRVFQITDQILNNGNRAFSELYVIRGEIYEKQGNYVSALAEYQNALTYHVNNEIAQEKIKNMRK